MTGPDRRASMSDDEAIPDSDSSEVSICNMVAGYRLVLYCQANACDYLDYESPCRAPPRLEAYVRQLGGLC